VVTTIAGAAGTNGFADDTNNNARFYTPIGIAVQNNTNVFVADFNNQCIRLLRPFGTNWVVSTIAGLGGTGGSANGTNGNGRFYQPRNIAFGALGSLYVTDSGNNTVRKILPIGTNWISSTVAGLAGAGTGSANGTGAAARFNSPYGIAMNSTGRLWVTDSMNRTVRLGDLAILLEISAAPSQLRISWPLGATNFVLETRASVNATSSWARITNGPSISADSWVWTTNVLSSAAYFRLHKP
jgi:hypothetical protein